MTNSEPNTDYSYSGKDRYTQKDMDQAIEEAERRGEEKAFMQLHGKSDSASHSLLLVSRLMKRFNLEPGKAGYIEGEIDKLQAEASVLAGALEEVSNVYDKGKAIVPETAVEALLQGVIDSMKRVSDKAVANLSPATQAAMAVLEAVSRVMNLRGDVSKAMEWAQAQQTVWEAGAEYERVMGNDTLTNCYSVERGGNDDA